MSDFVTRTTAVQPGYFKQISEFPMLTAESEHELACRWRDSGDHEALRQLVGSHLRLVIKIARSNSGYGLPIEDLVAQGNLGLHQAALRFEPDRGVRFASYAGWWIRAMIHEYVLHASSLVRMGTTAAQKKLFFNLRRLKGKLQAYGDGDLEPEAVAEIAQALDVPEGDVVEMNRRLAAPDLSLNAPTSAEDGDELQDFLLADPQNVEAEIAEADELAKRRVLLERAMERLTERERHIVTERLLRDEPLTLQVLSEHYNISRERVRQIEVKALKKLQDDVLSATPAGDTGAARRTMGAEDWAQAA